MRSKHIKDSKERLFIITSIDNTMFGSYFRTLALVSSHSCFRFLLHIMIVYRFYKMCTSVILCLRVRVHNLFRGTGKAACCRRKCVSYSACMRKTTLDYALSTQQDRQ